MKKNLIIRILTCIFVIAWMATIFFLSNQNSEKSSNLSGGIIKTVLQVAKPNFNNLHINEQTTLINNFQFIIRKAAHMSAYFILGILTMIAFAQYKITILKGSIFTGAICVLYAISDEIHQGFIPGRSPQITDVLIDFIGAVIGILITAFIIKMIKKRKI